MHVRSDSGAVLTLLGHNQHDRDGIQVIWRGERCRLQDFHLAKARSLRHTNAQKNMQKQKMSKKCQKPTFELKFDFCPKNCSEGVVLILKKNASLGSQVKNE